MKFWTIGAAALIALEGAAIACSCINTDDPAELRKLAAETVANAVALVEVEAVSGYNQATGAGEVMRVTRTLAGAAPDRFRIERRNFPSGASCDVEYSAGQRATVLLYQSAAHGPVPIYRTSGLCTVHLLDKPVFRDELLRLMRAGPGRPPAPGPERGR